MSTARLHGERFVRVVQEHLGQYKRDVLQIEEDGTWGDPPRPYGHILPATAYRANILPSIRDEFWPMQESRGWRRHRYFHHLTSSQALAFNLFHAVVAGWEECSSAYASALGLDGTTVLGADLEVVLDHEEGTNFDAVVSADNGRRVLVELKFTESAFGSAEPDDRHLAKLRDIYRTRLEGSVPARCLELNHFFANYQLYRNLAEAMRDDRTLLALLLPRAHSGIWEHADAWLRDLHGWPAAGRVRLISLEDVMRQLQADSHRLGGRLEQLTRELVRKYCVSEQT